jgi:hypothetical protein
VTVAWKGTVAKGFTRAAFAEYVSTIEFAGWIPELIILHNTQEPTLAEWHDESGEEWMHRFASYYRDDQGWSGGPHLFVADDLIWVFTPLTTPGVHSPSWNAISWGIETVGDFDHEMLEGEQLENLIEALRCLHRLAGFDTPQLKLHKDDPKTTHTYCPGALFDRALITRRLAAALGAPLSPSLEAHA